MKKIRIIILLCIAVGLVLSAIGLATGASRSLYWDRTGIYISGSGISSITEQNIGSVKSIHVDAGFSDVEFISSDTYGVDLFGENMEWQWTLEGDVLRVSHNQGTRMMLLNFDFFSGQRNYARIYLPDNVHLETLYIKTGSGNIDIGNFNADNIEVNNSFGNITLSNITSDHLQVDLNSGRFVGTNLTLQSLTYSNRFGNGRFQNVTTQGLSAESNSGDIYIDGEVSGETIIHAEFGDIRLTTSKAIRDYSYNISVRFGSITFDGQRQGDRSSIISDSTQENHLQLTSSSGDIRVNFAD